MSLKYTQWIPAIVFWIKERLLTLLVNPFVHTETHIFQRENPTPSFLHNGGCPLMLRRIHLPAFDLTVEINGTQLCSKFLQRIKYFQKLSTFPQFNGKHIKQMKSYVVLLSFFKRLRISTYVVVTLTLRFNRNKTFQLNYET